MNISTSIIDIPDNKVQLEVYTANENATRTIVCIPSLGRSVKDFTYDVFTDNQFLIDNHIRLILPEPRMIGKSTGSIEDNITLHDLASDIGHVLKHFKINKMNPAIVIGHAFGNRVARMLATDYPELVQHVILLAAGGLKPIRADIQQSVFNCFNKKIAGTDEHVEYIKLGFFATGNNVPNHWMTGWYEDAKELQWKATQSTPPEEWWNAGDKQLTLLQGMQDAVAPPEDTAALMKSQFGHRLIVHELPQCGHAILPEKPLLVKNYILHVIASLEM